MRRLECRGGSDDTFGVYGAGPDDDHDDCANFTVRTFLVDAGADGRVCVSGVYGKAPGGWIVGMAPFAEDDPWPTWAQPSWSVDGYTPVMVLTVPDHATVRLVEVDGEKYRRPRDEDDDR